MPPPKVRICVVCSGNICRSPTAEVVLRSMVSSAGLADRVTVESAGTGDWHVGAHADPRTLATLRHHGYDGSAHRARQYDPEWFAEHDLVLATDAGNAELLRSMAPPGEAAKVVLLRSFDPAAAGAGDLDVPDPYYGEGDGFERVLRLVEAACRGVVEQLAARLG